MADTITANFGFTKPEITGSPSTWGNKLNADLDAIDAELQAILSSTGSTYLAKTGGAVSGPITSSAGDAGGSQLVTHDQVVALINTYIPAGIVAIWAGPASSIPPKWWLCDGQNGTNDLRNRFIYGAGIGAGTTAPGASGGLLSFQPTITVDAHAISASEMPSHAHGVNDPGHAHGVSDPGHAHGINVFPQYNPILAGSTNVNLYAMTPAAGSTQPLVTTTVGTGVSIQGAATNISIGNAGGNGAHSHTASSTAVPLLPPWYSLCYIQRVGG